MSSMSECVLAGADVFQVVQSDYSNNYWQAIVKHRDKTRPWSCVVDANPEAAMGLAMQDFVKMNPPHRVRKRRKRVVS